MDLPTTRKAAKAANLNKYFTGEPCAHGHVAARYTDSGTCQECITRHARRSSNNSATTRAAAETSNDERRAVFQQLQEIVLRLSPNDLAEMHKLAGLLLQLRFPHMREEDAYVDRAGTRGAAGTLLYRFNAHPDDVEYLRAEAAKRITTPDLDIQAERARIFGSAVREYVTEYEPEFRP